MDIDNFFADYPESKRIFDALCKTLNKHGDFELKVTKSQIAFQRGRTFAWVWIPARHLRRELAPLVLTMGFRYRHPSPRWKEIIEPHPGRFTHHLELYSAADLDDEIMGWLKDALAGIK